MSAFSIGGISASVHHPPADILGSVNTMKGAYFAGSSSFFPHLQKLLKSLSMRYSISHSIEIKIPS